MPWSIVYSSAVTRDEVLGLPSGLLARYLRYADRMEQFGPDLGMPHTRAMGRGLFELRLTSAEGIARVMYCTLPDRRIVVLHAFEKKTEKTPRRNLEIAERRRKEVVRDQP